MSERIPLVLLPGLLNDERFWAHQTEHLGDVAETSVGDLGVADSVAGLAGAVLRAAPARFALAGLSMGGYVALEIMRRAPERVQRLALLDTNARADAPEQSERRRALVAQARAGGFEDIMPGMLPNLLHPEHLKDLALVALAKAMAERLGPEVFARQQAVIMGRPDSRPDLARIACPTLVLCGRQDSLTPLALHQEMADAIPGARLVVVEDAGHWSPLEQPQAVTAVLRYWLQV